MGRIEDLCQPVAILLKLMNSNIFVNYIASVKQGGIRFKQMLTALTAGKQPIQSNERSIFVLTPCF